jgi:hypothetical protein
VTRQTGIYVVPTHEWYIERAVWLIAGIVLLTSTTLAWLVDPRWIVFVAITGLTSIWVSLTGLCPVGPVQPPPYCRRIFPTNPARRRAGRPTR